MEHAQGTGAGLVLAGRYRLGEVLGRGGMGKVWRAQDELLHRTVAVKELTAGLYVAEADRAVLHARTQKEARAAARITHPGVVTVHDVVEYDNRPWIVMQYVDGPSLADAVKENGETSPRDAARIGLHVLRALMAAHAAGVLHRDVKPGNVLLARDGRVLLTDFGIAAIEGDSTITRTGELVGSVDYLALERVRGADPGPASDLWSLGATLYTAVEGHSPFRRTSPISTMQAVVSEEPSAPTLSGPLAPVIRALLCKDPAGRPTAAETERMLRDVMEGREARAAQVFVATEVLRDERRVATTAWPVPEPPPGSTTAWPAGPPPAGTVAGPPAGPPPPARGYAPSGPPAGRSSVPTVRRAGSRSRTALAAGAAALVLGGALGFAVMQLGGDDDGRSDGRGSTASTATSPPVTGDGGRSAQTAQEPAPTDGGTSAAAGEEVPEGWQRVLDPEGFSLLVPEGWERRPAENWVDYTPDEGGHRIRISVDPAPQFDSPLQHVTSMEQDVSARLPAYTRLALESRTFRDRPGALWEFTWTESKDHPGPRHGIDRIYYGAAGGPEYALYMTGPEEDWSGMRRQFDTMLRSWRAPGESAG
ncbi:serine/threonine-protein kinase [uncultured Streptomyces sp.]|uniref:serine/threonine-protein kinase n=1 Tax=uncultured Streptomyces sp. TaxID=174707 RepID=UPI00260A3D8C|nr:serine/threonine-protein kinase [uncultured Streptomyces sp.]